MKALKIATAAALLMTGGSAVAQSANDAQCLILSNAIAGQAKTDDEKKMAQSAFYFYLGRLGPAVTGTQLKALIEQQMKVITPATADKLANDCIKGVGDKVQMIQAISAATKAAQPQTPQTPQKKPEGR